MLDNEENKNLISVNDNIFTKIKKFFKRLFRIKIEHSYEINETHNITKNKKEIKESNFKNNIKVEENNTQRLMKLQDLIRQKKIKEEQLSDEDIIELRKLYKEQIKKLQDSIIQKRNKIMKIKYEQKRKAQAHK